MYCSRVLVTSDTNAARTCLFKQKKSLSRGNEKPGVASFRPGSIRGPAGVLGSPLSVSVGSPGKDGQDGPRATISGVPQQEITSVDSGENPTGPRTMGGWLPAYDGDSGACRGAANVPRDARQTPCSLLLHVTDAANRGTDASGARCCVPSARR